MSYLSTRYKGLIEEYYFDTYKTHNTLNLSTFDKDILVDESVRNKIMKTHKNITTIVFNKLFNNINTNAIDKQIFIHFITSYNTQLVTITFNRCFIVTSDILNYIKIYCRNDVCINKKCEDNRFITITLIKYDKFIEIAHNDKSGHSEINCWNKINKLIKKTKRKKSDILITEIRCRYNNGQFEYSYSQPCKHCTLFFKNISHQLYKQYGSKIKFNWSLDSQCLEMTKFINVTDIKDSTLSSRYAVLYKTF